MMELGKYAGAVIGSYAASVALIVVLVALVDLEKRAGETRADTRLRRGQAHGEEEWLNG